MIGLVAAIAMTSNWTVADLAFMRGSWECEVWGGRWEEQWNAPTAGAMQGMGRHIKEGKTAFMEFMSIEQSENGLTMWMLLGPPSKGPKTASPFKLTKVEGKEAWFENPKNDFPSKISYKATDHGLLCRLEGTQNGKPQTEDFKFRPMK